MDTYETAFTLAHGAADQADSLFDRLRFAGLNPRLEQRNGSYQIGLPKGEIPALRSLQSANPARWGKPQATEPQPTRGWWRDLFWR